MSKQAKLLKQFESGSTYTFSQIQKEFGLVNPTATITQLRSQGHCIYANKTKAGTVYRLGTPSKRMVALASKMFGSTLFTY